MVGIVIGARRSGRVMPETESPPKRLIDGFGDTTIFDWVLETFRRAGVAGV